MTPEGPILNAALALLAAAAVAAYMFRLGLALGPGEYAVAWRRPSLMLRGFFCSALAVPVVVIALARLLELPRAAQVGMVLMAACPGAPIALRRALGAGADASFTMALQVTLASATVLTMPLWVAALDQIYDLQAYVAPATLAWQVFVGQLLPLALGLAARGFARRGGPVVEKSVAAVAGALLAVFVALAFLDIWMPVWRSGARVALAIVLATAIALALGHALGGPEPRTRTALAVGSAARNAGLALGIATVNHAPEAVQATVLAYLLISAVAMTPYVLWRRFLPMKSAK